MKWPAEHSETVGIEIAGKRVVYFREDIVEKIVREAVEKMETAQKEDE